MANSGEEPMDTSQPSSDYVKTSVQSQSGPLTQQNHQTLYPTQVHGPPTHYPGYPTHDHNHQQMYENRQNQHQYRMPAPTHSYPVHQNQPQAQGYQHHPQYQNQLPKYQDTPLRYPHPPHGYPDQTQSPSGYPQQSSNQYHGYYPNPPYPSSSQGPNGDPNQFDTSGHPNQNQTFQGHVNSQGNYPDHAQHSSAQQFPSQNPVQQNPIHGRPTPPPPGFNTTPDVLWITDPKTNKSFPINAGDLPPEFLHSRNMPSPRIIDGRSSQESSVPDTRAGPALQRNNTANGKIMAQNGQETGDMYYPRNIDGRSSQELVESETRAGQQSDDGARAMLNKDSFSRQTSRPDMLQCKPEPDPELDLDSSRESSHPYDSPASKNKMAVDSPGATHGNHGCGNEITQIAHVQQMEDISGSIKKNLVLKHDGDQGEVFLPPANIPKYDLAVPRDMYKDKFGVAGLDKGISEDTLTNYVEVMSDCSVKKIEFTQDFTSALITLDQEPEWEKMQAKLSKRLLEGKKLSVTRLPVSDSVWVKRSGKIGEESLKLYLEHKKSGNTEKVNVTNVNIQDDLMIATFEHPSAVVGVMSKPDHELSGRSLDMGVWYQTLGLVTEMSCVKEEKYLQLDTGALELLRMSIEMSKSEEFANVEVKEEDVKIAGTRREIEAARNTIESFRKRIESKTISISSIKMKFLKSNMEFVLDTLKCKSICGIMLCRRNLELLAVSEDQLSQLEKWLTKKLREEPFPWIKDAQLKELNRHLKQQFGTKRFEFGFDMDQEQTSLVALTGDIGGMKEVIEERMPKQELRSKYPTSHGHHGEHISKSVSTNPRSISKNTETTTIDVPKYRWKFFQRYHQDDVNRQTTLHFDSGRLEICGCKEVVNKAQVFIKDILFSKMTAELLTITKPGSFRSILPCLVTYVEGRERCVIVDKVEELEASGKELELEGAVGGVSSTGAGGSSSYGGYGEETMDAGGPAREEAEWGHRPHYRSEGGEWKQVGLRGRSRRNREFVHKWSINIDVKDGEIAKEKVDVIVNTVSLTFDLEGGKLSQSIAMAGGKKLKEEYKKTKNDFKQGSYVVTGGGDMKCSHVFHCCLLPSHFQIAAQSLKDIVTHMLTYADKLKSETIAFPALGTGGTGYNPVTVAHIMVETIRNYAKTNPTSNIKEVRIVIYKNNTVMKAFQDLLKTSHGVTKPEASSHSDPPGKQCATVMLGEIAVQKVDIIVNPTNSSLSLGSGAVSQSLVRKGGDSIQQECHKKSPLSVWNFAVTNAGNLTCKKIYHCFLPSYDKHKYTNTSFLRNLILEMFEKAHSHKNKSIAIPALGTGNLGYPREFIAQTLFEVADEFWRKHPATTLTDIRFVIYHKDGESVEVFHKVEDKFKASMTSVHSPMTHSPAPTAPPRRHMTLMVGTVKVKIMQGDILKMLDRVEAIFNPIDSNMTFRFGLSKLLAEKGDKHFIPDSQSLVERLQKTKVACVMMNDKVDVVHMDINAIKENQRNVIYAALCEADRKDRKVLALPILQRADPGEKMAADLFSALMDLQKHKGNVVIREVSVVIHEENKFAKFGDKFKAMIARNKGHVAGVSEGGQLKVTLTIWSDERKLAQQAKQLVELFTKESDTPVTVPLMLPPTIQKENISVVGLSHENVNISISEKTSDYLMLKLSGKAGDVLRVIEEFYRCYKGEFKDFKEWKYSDVYFLKSKDEHRSGKGTGSHVGSSKPKTILPWNVKETAQKFQSSVSGSYDSHSKHKHQQYQGGRDKLNEERSTSIDSQTSGECHSLEQNSGSFRQNSRNSSLSEDKGQSSQDQKYKKEEDEGTYETLWGGAEGGTSKAMSSRSVSQRGPFYKMTWSFLDPDSDELIQYEGVSDDIESAYLDGKWEHKLPQSDGTTCVIDFRTMTEFPETDDKDRVPVFRREDIENFAEQELPRSWKDMDMKDGKRLKTITLKETDDAYGNVKKTISKACGDLPVSVIKIEKIQNAELIKRYKAKLELIKKNCRDDGCEMNLWYGCDSTDNIVPILNHGFNFSHCVKDGNQGYGMYFARSFHQVAKMDHEGTQYAFLCQVGVGNYTKGKYGKRYPSDIEDGCHSSVDDSRSPSSFTIFSDCQAYPFYLITYKVTKDINTVV